MFSPGESIEDTKYDQQREISLWERLGKAEMLDIESSSFSWDRLSSLHHTEHTSSNEHSEDEINRALDVCSFFCTLVYWHKMYNVKGFRSCVNMQITSMFKLQRVRYTDKKHVIIISACWWSLVFFLIFIKKKYCLCPIYFLLGTSI